MPQATPQRPTMVAATMPQFLPQPSTMSAAAHPLKVCWRAQCALMTRKAVRV